MKILRFNHNENMEKLREYGFSYTIGEDWHRYFNNISVSRGDNDEFVVDCDFEFDYETEEIYKLLLLEYDLTKANLLVVEEAQNELQ